MKNIMFLSLGAILISLIIVDLAGHWTEDLAVDLAANISAQQP